MALQNQVKVFFRSFQFLLTVLNTL